MRLKYFIFGIIILLCARSAHAVQTIDKRQYVDWNSYPYNQIVAFQHELPNRYVVQNCTAQYVAKDIILTARHCITEQNGHDNWAEKNKQEYTIYQPNKTFTKDLVLEQYGHDTYNNDWALLRITNPEFYSETPLSLDSATHTGKVTSAGFGYMRILNDDEIQTIRDHLNNHCTDINNQYCTSDCSINCINSLIQLGDTNTDYTIRYREGNNTYTISNFINHLKAHPNCQIINTASGITTHLANEAPRTPKYDSTCRIVSNDSGGLYINPSNKIQAVISSGAGNIFTSDNAYHSFPQPIDSDLYSAYTAMLNSSASVTTTPVINTPSTTTPVQPTPSSETTEIEQQISDVEKKINNAVGQGNLTNEKTFEILMDVATYQELQKKYEAAKAREQSIPNKLLGGLTMAATGVGGQMLATGLAEQRADEAAERDMRAYLATFRCDYGQGRNITGGETNIQLPGGNELLQFVTEYKQLAASLKSDKEALGIMPGIESEIISDSANMDLYNNVSIGRGQGAFTSLSRALLDENSDDAKEWAEQTASAHKKKNTGLIIGATGAIGGMVGNIVINHDKDADTTNAQPEKNTDETIFSDCDKDDCEFDFSINPDIDTSDINDENIFMANLASYTLPANGKKTGTPTTQAVPVSFATAQSDFSKINDTLFAKAFNQALTTQLRKSGKTLDSSKLKDQGGTFLYQAKQKNLNPFVSSAISFYESTYGTSPAARNKNNIAGLMSGGKTVTYNSVPDSIAAQARSLRNFYIDKRGNTEINNMTYDGGTTKWKKGVTSITKLLYKTYNDLATKPIQ